MKSIVSRSVEEGERERRGGNQGRNSVTSFDPHLKVFLIPALPPPASSASHVHVLPCQAPVCRYEIREKEIQGSMPAHKVCSGLTCLVLILASAYLLILICSHHICQHQYLKLNYRLGVAQNGGNDDYNQTSRSTIQRCLKLNTHTPLSPVFPSL